MADNYEEFTEGQVAILERFVTNTEDNIFVLRNLPEVIKGALFSRYSRSTRGLRSLLLKDFILNEETAFESIIGPRSGGGEEANEEQIVAIKKAQNFYDRILDGYGDDSIGELGGAHLAIEEISMLGAKRIEDSRIGGSPLEKSTRYIYFDQKIGGEFRFYREPVLMTSAYREIYVATCDRLFEVYGKLIPPLTTLMEERFPKDEESSKAAYTAAVRAKVLDCLRGLLPASTLTNMGVYGNGRFFEGMIHKLHIDTLDELRVLGQKALEELFKVIPSFVRRANSSHRHHQGYAKFYEGMRGDLRVIGAQHKKNIPADRECCEAVSLIDATPDAPIRLAAALLYESTGRGMRELIDYCRTLSQEDLNRILDVGCNRRENRRHKSPRALEHISFTFDLMADFGIYRDLHRHRMCTQERQLLSCDYGYCVPSEIQETELLDEYCGAMNQAKEVYDTIAAELPEEAQYVVPMAYKIRWYFHINLRALQWLCELRSSPAGHPNYRYIAQAMADAVSRHYPQLERFFKFVDYEGYDLGRLGQEERTKQKRMSAEQQDDD